MVKKPLEKLIKLNTYDCLWTYILRILAEKPAHAYSLRKEIKNRFGFEPGTVTSYKVLYLLETDGYVEREKHGRKVIYTITEKGSDALKMASRFYRKQFDNLSI